MTAIEDPSRLELIAEPGLRAGRSTALPPSGQLPGCPSRSGRSLWASSVRLADWVQEQLEPKGLGVVLEPEHLCMSLRGVQKLGAKTVTSALRGLVREDLRTRQQFLALTTRNDS